MFQSDKRFENCPNCTKNVTLNPGANLKQFFLIGVKLFFVFAGVRKR